MASWKEKGVVPDSDDEEEGLDSQSITGGYECDKERDKVLHDLEINEVREVQNDGRIDYEKPLAEDNIACEQPTTSTPSEALASRPNDDSQINSPISSPGPQRSFKDPRTLFDLGDETRSQSHLMTQASPLDPPAEDEISTSYVRITSPTSSPLSSVPGSQFSEASQLEIFQNLQSPGNPPIQRTSATTAAETAPLQAFEEPVNRIGRSLRQRNPIQLHPYIVEQEKYRQFLRARGMTPIRLAPTPDEYSKRSRDVSSPELESQELETEESQPADIDLDSMPSSSAQVPTDENAGEPITKDDEEFPDIDKLFQERRPIQSRLQSNRRQKSKSKHPLSRIQTQSAETANRPSTSNSIFDVPASPPPTSSPLPIISRGSRSASRAVSISSFSRDPSPSGLEEDGLGSQKPTNLLTPATSAVKPILDPVLIDSGSDGEDPFATDLSSSPSSSDESVEIRKISRKIRGVLPASHLRLDQRIKKPRAPSRTHRESQSASPAKQLMRRGVALPKPARTAQNLLPSTNNRLPFLSDDSDEGENEFYQSGFIYDDSSAELQDPFGEERMGLAEEEDKIDAMLPPRKRHGRGPDARPRKKRRSGSSSLFPKGGQIHRHQSKLTEHLIKPRKSHTSKGISNRYVGEASRQNISGDQKSPAPPRLGILDVIGQGQRNLPQFIKIAARAVKHKKDHGRQSPSKKFIRLANREDTSDVHLVLQDWKDGKIVPKDLDHPVRKDLEISRNPLNRIADNQQTMLHTPMAKMKHRAQIPHLDQKHIRRPRKLVVSKRTQKSINDFVTTERPSPHQRGQHATAQLGANIIRKRQSRPPFASRQSRPAQLELSEMEYSHRHPATAFVSRKKALDTLYRNAPKRHAPQSNIQLNRFLADDVAEPSAEIGSLPEVSGIGGNDSDFAKRFPRRRKRPPQRIDVGAAVYRQPSEPLILESLALTQAQEAIDDNRLQGLGKFGTNYTTHFDVFPLQSGIFFHESTFIGSGRLSKVLKSPGPVPSDVFRPYISCHLGDKEFRWGPWNDDVSSDIGVCFDWVLDQLNLQCPSPISSSARDDVVGAATHVVDYVQHHLSFADLQHRSVFLSRMIEVVSEFSSRLDLGADTANQMQFQYRVEVMSIWTVLVMQLLQISRNQIKQPSTTSRLEGLLTEVSRHCVRLLLRQGLESIRRLYDDLQYLSFRQNGIKRDRYAAQAWVILIKVLGTARIPRGSFWDVANTHLLDINMPSMNDARLMEKLWYSMFSLLPLCEFDESGVVIPGQRQEAFFDNWLLPQRMLKSVFTLYLSGSRQSPSFNDYCRALVGRCHFLMLEWGWWKCNGIIGVLFDFFASQNLGHLRNEEAYRSPHFLEELDKDVSLAVEPEDRCFHIFLKIVALGVKHMRQAGEGKGIRNLVTRLLPNHDRQYPKEEELDTRDLASLRNHHDLLCTLYWAAPPDQQPSLTLIQELVIANRSHNAACMINLRAWQQLARFVLTLSTASEAFQPFILWQNTFFSKLLNQYLEEDPDARRQASLLGGAQISETRLQETIVKNKRSTMALLRSSVHATSYAVGFATSTNAVMAAFNTNIIKSILDTEDFRRDDLGECLIMDTLDTLGSYMERIQQLHPPTSFPLQSAPCSAGDSQGSLDIDMDVDRQMMIYPLYEEIRPRLCQMIRQILECRLYSAKEPRFMKTLIEIWARMVSLITEESSELKTFLPGGECAVFVRRRGSERANKYWPLFLGELLHYKTIEDFAAAGFDIGLEWLLALTMPLSEPASLTRLTLSMYEKKHPLIKPFNGIEATLRSPLCADAWLIRHLVKGAIDSMRESSKGPSQLNDGNAKSGNRIARRDFSSVLKEVMDSMQRELELMTPGSVLHEQYVGFCQGVAEDIRSRGSEILPLTSFFVRSSAHYWPEEGDPKLFAAGIISYSLRLREQPGRTSSELFHYLYRGWRSDLINGRLKNHVVYVTKGMKHWAFTEFILTNFVPAALHAGFNSEFGWILPSTYLPPLADRASRLLERNDSEAQATLGYLANILKIIINGFAKHYSLWQTTIKGIHPLNRGIMAVACQFWLALVPAIKGYVERHANGAVIMDEVNVALNTFSQQTVRAFSSSCEGSCEVATFDVAEGPHVKNIVSLIMDDHKNWSLDQAMDTAMLSASGRLSIGGFGVQETKRAGINLGQLWVCTLREVLEIGRPLFETGHPCPLPENLRDTSTEPSRSVPDLFF